MKNSLMEGFNKYFDKKLNEELKLYTEIGEYKPWSGAEDTWYKIVDADMVSNLEDYLEEMYPEGLSITALNDLLWFEGESVLSALGLSDYPKTVEVEVKNIKYSNDDGDYDLSDKDGFPTEMEVEVTIYSEDDDIRDLVRDEIYSNSNVTLASDVEDFEYELDECIKEKCEKNESSEIDKIDADADDKKEKLKKFIAKKIDDIDADRDDKRKRLIKSERKHINERLITKIKKEIEMPDDQVNNKEFYKKLEDILGPTELYGGGILKIKDFYIIHNMSAFDDGVDSHISCKFKALVNGDFDRDNEKPEWISFDFSSDDNMFYQSWWEEDKYADEDDAEYVASSDWGTMWYRDNSSEVVDALLDSAGGDTISLIVDPVEEALYDFVPMPKNYADESLNKSNKRDLKESDKPASTSIEDAQKWVDYDMKKYGKISGRTNRLIRKAGFQIVKDTYGDYEVIAGHYE